MTPTNKVVKAWQKPPMPGVRPGNPRSHLGQLSHRSRTNPWGLCSSPDRQL